ncbi:MAG TPA: hypothetical protein VMR31_12065 [Myxococcota bacterium]|nr:hypothetical protein [Myxococcota bacterium]
MAAKAKKKKAVSKKKSVAKKGAAKAKKPAAKKKAAPARKKAVAAKAKAKPAPKAPPTKPAATPLPKPAIAARPQVVPAKPPAPAGSVTAADVNLGHVAQLGTHAGFKLEAFQAAKRVLEGEHWPTIAEAARAVAAKAVEISNEAGGRNGFNGH